MDCCVRLSFIFITVSVIKTSVKKVRRKKCFHYTRRSEFIGLQKHEVWLNYSLINNCESDVRRQFYNNIHNISRSDWVSRNSWCTHSSNPVNGLDLGINHSLLAVVLIWSHIHFILTAANRGRMHTIKQKKHCMIFLPIARSHFNFWDAELLLVTSLYFFV